MPAKWRGAMTLVVGSLIAVGSALVTTNAYASTTTTTTASKHHAVHVIRPAHSDVASSHVKRSLIRNVSFSKTMSFSKSASFSKSGKARYGWGGGISCVPFARAATGIALKGNAVNWWDAAAGVYERGNRPEAGSILNFRATGHMRLGHVAVVTNVLGDREVEIDHANWWGPGAGKGGVSRGIRVQDVSESNDWSAVRVALGHSEEFGSVYPTYGFIYDRPDSGRMVANARPSPSAGGDRGMIDEVAEAPMPRVIYPAGLSLDAPDHSLR
jgi:surface antigen